MGFSSYDISDLDTSGYNKTCIKVLLIIILLYIIIYLILLSHDILLRIK